MRFGAILLVLLSIGVTAQDAAVTGRVLDPDGQPVTSGTAALLTTPNGRVTAAIARDGQFRIVPESGQPQSLFISVPGFAPYRAYVNMPASRRIALPPIQLQPATYFRARFITTDGETIGGSIRRRSIDADGMSIPDPLEHVQERADASGAIVIGPLPPGRTVMAFDRSGWAQTRVRDAIVNGRQPLIDAGTITVGTGGTLHVDVVDGAGVAVSQHNVWIEDAVQPSPLMFMPAKTNAEGRADFTHLAPGRFRVWTQTVDRCGMQFLAVSRLVSSSGSGEVQTRLVVGGRARLRITTPLGPLNGKLVAIAPDVPGTTPWAFAPSNVMLARRMAVATRFSPAGCSGQTDSEGRVAVSPFPPGPAEVRIPLINSTYIAHVTIADRGPEIAIEIPDGLIPVKVVDRGSHNPVSTAVLVWTGAGSRVETITNANGDALIEAPGAAGGTLNISARDYETLEGAFPETPDTMQEVAMTRVPSERTAIRVESDGKPLNGAAVLVSTSRLGDADEIGTTSGEGIAVFTDLPPGALRVTVALSGYITAHQAIPAESRAEAVISLKRVQ